ncbi:M3 family metallopeptidase [Oceanobacillus profundus]|uniref:M3 family metallopeptidase n=1 Tax=Oceanobacillus profundus TaxID=372463 RepID=UPI0020403CFF|nr:M3 family metallopeptidase [Oceanobacillus profundus]MCM3399781.1 M3 family metallopeptidase [Oceanobacillus profundus]
MKGEDWMDLSNTKLVLSLINERLQNKYQQYIYSLWLMLTTNDQRWVEQLEQDEKSYNDEISSPNLIHLIRLLQKDRNMDLLSKRQISCLYNEMLELSLNPSLQHRYTKLWNEAHYVIATNKTEFKGKKLTEQQVLRTLETEQNNSQREELWYQYMKVGDELQSGLIELVNIRNKIAKEKGFENFYDLKLSSQGLDKIELNSIITGIRTNLDGEYSYIKKNIDKQLQDKFNIKQLYPWHYPHPFFQEVNLSYLEDPAITVKTVTSKLTNWFQEIGLDIKDILKNSDISANEDKSAANFCLNIDRDKDVRISAHYHQNQKSLSLLLHELGHAVYEYNVNMDLPFILKKSSEIFMSEASAIYFERLVFKKSWYRNVISNEGTLSDKFIGQGDFVSHLLVKVYWTMTMTIFEQELYRNPNQDLNRLWWDIVGEVQRIEKPIKWDIPVWAVKPHLTTLPAYYHNYLLGEIIASQIGNNMERKYRSSHSTEGIQYLKENIFWFGHSKSWRNILKSSFQDQLNPGYLIYDIKQLLENEM